MRRLTPVEIQKLIFLHESASIPLHRLAKRSGRTHRRKRTAT
jgi:hypothetical protein